MYTVLDTKPKLSQLWYSFTSGSVFSCYCLSKIIGRGVEALRRLQIGICGRITIGSLLCGRILGRNPDKSLNSFPLFYSLFTVTSTTLPWDFYFFKLTQSLTISTVKLLYTGEEREKKGVKPTVCFKKFIRDGKPQVCMRTRSWIRLPLSSYTSRLTFQDESLNKFFPWINASFAKKGWFFVFIILHVIILLQTINSLLMRHKIIH